MGPSGPCPSAGKRYGWLVTPAVILVIVASAYALAIREVALNVEQVKSIETPFEFAVLGDSHDGEKVYRQLLKGICERTPAFVIHLGDMVSNADEKEWDTFFKDAQSISLPFFPVVGNHDVYGSPRGYDRYRRQFRLPEEKTYYAFQTGGSLFVVLDSERGIGRILVDQWTWLEETLSSSNVRHRLVFLHRPLFLPFDSLKSGRAMDQYPSERDQLHDLFVRNGVRMVFAGHDHRYDRRKKGDVTYIISGGGGGLLSALEERGGFFHYLWVCVDRDKIEVEVIDLEGQTRDRFMIDSLSM